ncbi:MAG: putative toxin-antitoxin system toxin component, PIN family [Thermodesulfovibrionales bacterium]|jgi:putative PIN family toxin of toxin-antitoxin system
MIRVVIDANQFVSALLKPDSNPAAVIRMAREEKIQLVMSSEIVEEIRAVLLYPKIVKRHHLPPEEIDLFLQKLMKVAVVTHSRLELDVIKEDPSDNKYLECAIEGRADYIISGDSHLTSLKTFHGVRIVDPAHFLEKLVEKE